MKPRELRDRAAAVGMLLVLFGMLIAINQTVRERVAEFAGGGSEQRMAPVRTISHVVSSTAAAADAYTAGNGYLVLFLVAAGLLFVLMLRT